MKKVPPAPLSKTFEPKREKRQAALCAQNGLSRAPAPTGCEYIRSLLDKLCKIWYYTSVCGRVRIHSATLRITSHAGVAELADA